MSPSADWIRLTGKQGLTCPVCGKPDACLVKRDGKAALCLRIKEGCARRRDGSPVEAKNGMGWVHNLEDQNAEHIREKAQHVPRQAENKPKYTPRQWWAMATKGHEQLTDDWHGFRFFAQELGVDTSVLLELLAGWSRHHKCHSFPMWDGRGNVIGIRLRHRSGKKFSVTGSRSGIFIPYYQWHCEGPLVVCEGPTDTAALRQLRYPVIGRPFNKGGSEYVIDYCRQNLSRGSDIVIMHDRDERGSPADQATREGGKTLAEMLDSHGFHTKIVIPPQCKDAREWIVRKGATRRIVDNAIEAARYDAFWRAKTTQAS